MALPAVARRLLSPKLPHRMELPYLAERLPTVEINGTFYSLTRPEICTAWRKSVPDGFVFAVKGSRYITHMLKLKNFEHPLANFFASGLLLLGRSLGPILWQLPPQLPWDEARARAFFDALPRDVASAERWARRHDQRTTGSRGAPGAGRTGESHPTRRRDPPPVVAVRCRAERAARDEHCAGRGRHRGPPSPHAWNERRTFRTFACTGRPRSMPAGTPTASSTPGPSSSSDGRPPATTSMSTSTTTPRGMRRTTRSGWRRASPATPSPVSAPAGA